MSDPFAYGYPSPLAGYENLNPLSEYVSPHKTSKSLLIICRERNEDGKSLKNPQTGVLSKSYEEFPDPLSKGREGGFDIHIYHFQVGDSTSCHVIRTKKLIRTTPTKSSTQKRSGSESAENVRILSPPHTLDIPTSFNQFHLNPANQSSPRAKDISFLGPTYRSSSSGHVRGESLHAGTVRRICSLAGDQPGPAKCFDSS